MRVKLGAGAGLDILHGLRQRPGLLVGALAEQGIEYIDYRHNPRRQRDLLTSQLLRVALAIEVLVVAPGDLCPQREVTGSLHHFARLVQDIGADTGEHVLRVQKLSDAIVAELKKMAAYPEQLTPEFVEMIGMASILHDVGKVGTPDHILHKPGRFDPEERAIMEQHAGIGANILHKAGEMVEGTSYLSLGAEIARGHHEHFDGKGYPQQLAGQQIPLSARIVAVIDVFDALLSKRPYKEPWTLAQTMEYIQSRSGTQFDPHVVTALSRLVNESRLPYSL